MRINGRWVETDDTLPRPTVEAQVETIDGRWIDCPFLIDTGADATVFSPRVLRQLGRPVTLARKQLGGVGGPVETWEVWTTLRLVATDGSPANIEGTYSAFQIDGALEMSVLGYDVLHLFALIVDRPADAVCLIRPAHRYTIQGG